MPSSGDEDQVIGGARADGGRDLRAAARRRARRRGCVASGRAALPASRIARDSSGVKTPVSQKTSHHSASFARRDRGNHLVDDESHVSSSRRSRYSRGNLVRSHERRRRVDRVRRAEPAIARSIFSSLSRSGRSRS